MARRDGELAGLCASWDIQVGVPGAGGSAHVVPAEGLTWVGVHPDHSRRGVLRALMAHHLRWTRDEQGRALAALKASEPGIYGRFGYGVATSVVKARFTRGTPLAAPQNIAAAADATQTRFGTAGPDDAERLYAVALTVAAAGPAGTVVRSLDDVRRLLTDVPELRQGKEPQRILWATRDGRDVGCAVLRRIPKWDDGSAGGEVDVSWLGSVDAAARLALMRRILDLDLMGSAVHWVGPDDPLLLWCPSLRSVRGTMTDSLWLRLVDLPAAVAQRGHARPCDLRVAVADPLLPENDAVWRWRADGDTGTTERVGTRDEAADLSLDIADLAAVWLGGQTLGARAAAGFVAEHTPGAVAELDAALRTPTGPAQAVDF